MPSVTRRRSAVLARRPTEASVLAAVERLLAGGESFTTLPVARIAEEAGIRRSTFYDYFPDKTTLIRKLTESATAALFEAAGAFVQDDTSTRADLVAVVRNHVREYRRHAPLLAAVSEVAAYDPDIAAWWRSRVEAFAAASAARLRRGCGATAARVARPRRSIPRPRRASSPGAPSAPYRSTSRRDRRQPTRGSPAAWPRRHGARWGGATR